MPSIARYRGKISYLPVTDKNILRKTRLTTADDRRKFGESHFDCEDVLQFSDCIINRRLNDISNKEFDDIDLYSSVKDAFEGTLLIEVC